MNLEQFIKPAVKLCKSFAKVKASYIILNGVEAYFWPYFSVPKFYYIGLLAFEMVAIVNLLILR